MRHDLLDKLLVRPMAKLARATFFLVGMLLTATPVFAYLAFGYGVGDPPQRTFGDLLFLVVPLAPGLLFGGGLLLVGLPGLVEGARRPMMRTIAGVLLVISTIALFAVGFKGTVTAVLGPLAIAANAAALWLFVFPAKFFAKERR